MDIRGDTRRRDGSPSMACPGLPGRMHLTYSGPEQAVRQAMAWRWHHRCCSSKAPAEMLGDRAPRSPSQRLSTGRNPVPRFSRLLRRLREPDLPRTGVAPPLSTDAPASRAAMNAAGAVDAMPVEATAADAHDPRPVPGNRLHAVFFFI